MQPVEPSSDHHPGRRSLRSIQLALLSQSVFDVPPRTRYTIILAGIVALVFAVSGSLIGGDEGTIEVDKVIHFTSYATLATLFVLALRPILYIPALLGLVILGVAIEFIQPLNGRNFDTMDMAANTMGVVMGAILGLVVRTLLSQVRKAIALSTVRKRLVTYEPGTVILREGSLLHHFFAIKSGAVQLERTVDEKTVDLGLFGPGEVIGVLGVIQGMPQYATVTATSRTTLYRMDLEELMDAAGGREQPVALVLNDMAQKLRELADYLIEKEIESANSLQQRSLVRERRVSP